MSDIVVFIRARLAHERHVAQLVETDGPWWATTAFSPERGEGQVRADVDPLVAEQLVCSNVAVADAVHIDLQDPAATLRRVEALERIIDAYEALGWIVDAEMAGTPELRATASTLGGVLRLVASMWPDSEGYDPAWAVE